MINVLTIRPVYFKETIKQKPDVTNIHLYVMYVVEYLTLYMFNLLLSGVYGNTNKEIGNVPT